MNSILKFTACILLIGVVTSVSCNKNNPVPNTSYNYPQQPIQDSLSGKEFVYNNLTWGTWGNQVVQVEVPNSYFLCLYFFPQRKIKVYIDSSFLGDGVPFYTVEFGFGAPVPFPPNNGFIYDNNYFANLFLFAIGANNNQLIGSKVSVKVKVL